MDLYSYNGVELPDINTVWTDKETYPYANISAFETRKLGLAKRIVFDFDGNGDWSVFFLDVKRYTLSEDRTKWISGAEGGTDWCGPPLVGWSNVDILNEDGSVYLAASKPIPVGYGIISLADYEAACDAIRSKTGKTEKIKSGELKTEVESMPSYIAVATEEEATDTTTIPIKEGQVIVVTGE